MTTTVARAEADGLLAAAQAALDGVADVEAWTLSDQQVTQGVVRLQRLSRLVAAQQLRLVAEAETRGLPAKAGHRRPSGWLRSVLPTLTAGQAAALAGRAETLFTAAVAAELTATRDAVLAGDVALDQAEVVAGAVAALVPPQSPAGTVDAVTLVEAEAFLLQQARAHDARALARLATSLRVRLDPDADDRLARDELARDQVRGLTMASLPSRMVHVSGLLTPECGAALATAIDAWSAPQPSADGTPDPRTSAQRRHDGLLRLAETAITATGVGRLPSTHGSPYRIIASVPHHTLAAALAGDPLDGHEPARLADATALSAHSLRVIACGAEIVPVVIDDDGNPLDVGDTQYAFPTKQRLAIASRDGHCTYPGCTAPPSWCQVHHLERFADGGPTSVSNGALLCGFHHRYVHASGQVGRLVRGVVVWRGAVGETEPTRSITRAQRALDHLARRWLARRRC